MRKVPVPRVTSFRLDDALHHALNDLAVEKNTQPSKLIRRAVQEMLAREALARSLEGFRNAA